MECSKFHQEESINSSQEVEQDNDFGLGVGRSYECVYCRRGFDSAQALGGHMNIHRKDKLRNKPTSSSKQPEDSDHYTSPRLYQQIPESRNDHLEQHHMKYSTHFQEYAGTSGGTRPEQQQIHRHTNDFDRDRNRLIRGDWRVGLEYTPLVVEDLEKDRQMGKVDLDLELRLGYDS